MSEVSGLVAPSPLACATFGFICGLFVETVEEAPSLELAS